MSPASFACCCWCRFPRSKLARFRRRKCRPDEPDDVVRITTNLVQVDAVVTDKEGRHISDLEQQDFEIFENDKRQEITNFCLRLFRQNIHAAD
ncbi:MAG: hypothetical protein WKF84_15570 [Pyrinomonadaceae bacterium]